MAYFHKIFLPNKGNLDIPLFEKILNFDANKEKIPLFVFPCLDSPLYKVLATCSINEFSRGLSQIFFTSQSSC